MRYRHVGIAVLTILASVMWAGPAAASSPQLPNAVSQQPVPWTPNVMSGATMGQSVCNSTYFGSGSSCLSEVYGTAYVNGDVVVVGAFTHVCEPTATSECASTPVVRNDIFAYSASTGKIDPNFHPTLDQGPAFAVVAGPAGSNTVFVGGQFTSVNGVTRKGLVQLNVDPGSASDGTVVTGFKANVANFVRRLALSPGGKALYVGGQFASLNGTSETGLARVSSATGAVDSSFHFTLSGQITVGGKTLPIKVTTMDIDGNGGLLAVGYSALQVNGQSRPRLAVINTGGGLGSAAKLTDFTAPILKNNCSAEHDYVRALSFAANGQFLVIGDTGFLSDGSTPYAVCDAAARFDVTSAAAAATGTSVNISPSWINYTGGDSIYSISIAGNMVYAGGHNRWTNDYCGINRVCEQNAVLTDGLSAYDAHNGMAIAWWQPQTLRGHGTMYVNTFGAGTYDGANSGLVIGNDVNVDAGATHSKNAIFVTGPQTTSRPTGPIPSGMFAEEGGSSTKTPMCLDAPDSTSGSPVFVEYCLNVAAQNWTVPTGGNAGSINVSGLCLGTTNAATTSGTGVVLVTCDSTSATQSWQQIAGNELRNVGATSAQGTAMCLTDPAGSMTPGTGLRIAACSGSQSQVWPLPAAPGSGNPVPTGPIFSQANRSNTQVPCIDDANNSTATGNKVQMWTCIGGAAEDWTLDSSHTIRLNGSNYCLDTASGGTASGTLLVLDPCNGSSSQTWNPGPNNTLIQASSRLCLSDPGGNNANGTQLDIETCPAGNNNPQAWRLPGVAAPAHNVISVIVPATQTGTVGVSTSLQISASDSEPGAQLTYSASGLPAGLSIDSGTGLIQGTPQTANTYHATVTVTDSTGAAGSAQFTWTISASGQGPTVGMIRGYAGKCVADANYQNTPGTKVVIHRCSSTLLRDQWTVGPNKELQIRGLCLTDPHWGRWRTGLTLEPCHGWTNQRWTHHANGEYTVAVHNLCMTDPRWSTRDGTQIIIRSCRDWKNQRWTTP